MEDINFKVKLNLKDYRNFNYFYAYSGTRGFFINFAKILLILTCIFITIYGIKNGNLFTPFNIFFVSMTIALILMPLILFFQSKKIFNSDKFLSEEQDHTINEEGMIVKTSATNAVISWDKIFSIKENKNYIYIFLAQNKAFIVPKKNIQDKLKPMKELFIKHIIKEKLKIKKNHI